MEMIIGGAFQGKGLLAQKRFPERIFVNGEDAELSELFKAGGILNLQAYIKRAMQAGEDLDGFARELIEKNPSVILVCDEVGYGVVPVDAFDRAFREKTGRICCELSAFSDRVTRVICGIPTDIKDEVKIRFVRHGKTFGNTLSRYIGITDEPLTQEGAEEIRKKRNPKEQPSLVVSSPLKRAVQTAQLLFPETEVQVIEAFRECDFGAFENKNYKELESDSRYRSWVDGGCRGDLPEGETRKEIRERLGCGMEELLARMREKEVRSCIVVTHGGVIMELLSRWGVPEKDYYEWRAANGEGYTCRLDRVLWEKGIRKLEVQD